MVYSIIGLDRSAFGLLSASLNHDVRVTTYEAPRPLFTVKNATPHPMWSRVIQGIGPEWHGLFTEHLSSYVFRRPQNDTTCSVVPEQVRIIDPFADEPQAITVTIWLPRREGVRSVAVDQPDGYPLIGFVNAP